MGTLSQRFAGNATMQAIDSRLIDGLGLWFEDRTSARSDGNPAVFLDRDGVIVEETGYLKRAEDVRLIDGVSLAIRAANRSGLRVVIVTNQSGIGRQYYSWREFDLVQEALHRKLALCGAHVDLVLACAYHASASESFRTASHPWRKPNPGMIWKAAEYLKADLSRSILVGDRLTDLLAGQKAGIRNGILVQTGYGAGEMAKLSSVQWEPMNVYQARNLGSVPPWPRWIDL